MEKISKLAELKKIIDIMIEHVEKLEDDIIEEENESGKYKDQIKALEEKSNKVFLQLTGIILFALIILTTLMITKSGNESIMILRSILIVISCGAMGSSISALTSSLDRRAKGWELETGKKLPREIPIDKFSMRMSPFFLYRPILGIVAAILVWAMIKSDMINPGEKSDYYLIFWTTLAGLFAKTLFEKLKDLFKSIIPGS